MIKPETTVREVAVQYPQTLKVFEEHGIDYCCGGGDRLADAAAARGVELEALTCKLEEAISRPAPKEGPQRNWASAGLTELADFILQTHHVFMKAQLPRLQEMAAMVVQAHGPRHGDVLVPLRERYLALKAEIEAHLRKEEEILFPFFKKLEAHAKDNGGKALLPEENLEDLLAATVEEHETVGAALADMRSLTSDYELPEDACPTYGGLYHGLADMERDLHRHIHLENNILFPGALALAQKS